MIGGIGMYFNRFTQGAKAAIDLGKNCAKSLGHRVVGTEHLVCLLYTSRCV